MPLTLIAPPDATPVALEDAKAWARVDYDDDDALIEGMIAAATEEIEILTGRQFAPATYALTLRCFPQRLLDTLPAFESGLFNPGLDAAETAETTFR